MNFWNLVYRAAEYGIILPGIFLCIIPVADWLIIPQRKLYPVLLPCMVAVCFVLAWVDSSGSYYTNIFFFPLLGICLIAYFLTVKLEKLKLLYMFLCATAALSFGCIMNYYIIARIDPHSNIHDDSVPGNMRSVSSLCLCCSACGTNTDGCLRISTRHYSGESHG